MTDKPPPGEPIPPPSSDLIAYFRRYGNRFTREAMAARLIEGGHDADAVERALAAVNGEPPPPSSDIDHSRARLVSRVMLVVAILLFAVYIVSGGTDGPGQSEFALAAIGIAAVFAAVGIWGIGRVKNVEAMIAIVAAAIMVGLPAAFLGGCFAYLNGGGSLF